MNGCFGIGEALCSRFCRSILGFNFRETIRFGLIGFGLIGGGDFRRCVVRRRERSEIVVAPFFEPVRRRPFIGRIGGSSDPFHRELHVEPARLIEGMVVKADGTDWNPGAGAGFYGYSGAWVKLG